MNILNIAKEQHKAVIELDCDELVTLCNALYHDVQRETDDPNIYNVYAKLIVPKDLATYGKIPSFSMEAINEYMAKAKELRNNDKG